MFDVAGGPGEPSLTIAEVVGPTGSVTCTDAVAEMVAAAEREARRRGVTNIRFRQCTADSLPFDSDSFDAAVSRLGVMFFPDPPAGLREVLRVVRPLRFRIEAPVSPEEFWAMRSETSDTLRGELAGLSAEKREAGWRKR